MNKEEALIEFLKGLRVAIHNSLAYRPNHPYYLKSAEDFKQKVDNLFTFLNPIKINVTPESLFLDGKVREKDTFSLELAQILHSRKVKSLEFKLGLKTSELVTFLSCISLQPKEIIKRNGLGNMLKETGIEHIFVEELDYSQLLGKGGEEAKDIWLFLFKETLKKQDPQEICEFADSFLEGIDCLSAKKIIEDDKLREDLSNFLAHLNSDKNNKFSKCIQQLSRVVLDSGAQVNCDDVKRLKEVFANLKDSDFVEILLAQLSGKKQLNVVNFELFSQLAGEERLDNISSLLAKNRDWPKDNPLSIKKIQALLSSPDSNNISPAYRNALAALVKDVTFKDTLSFDLIQLSLSYRRVMLTLFNDEKHKESLELIFQRLTKDWQSINPKEDYRFFRSLFDIVERKKNNGEFNKENFVYIEKWITDFVEADMWSDELSEDHIYLLDSIQNTYLSLQDYLNKIFKENKCSVYGLRRFLKFFPSETGVFFEELKAKCSDLDFLSQIIKVFVQLNSNFSLSALKQIFSYSNEIVKAMVLKAMQEIKEFDPEFVLSILKDNSVNLKNEALAILIKDEQARRAGIDVLLNIPSPWGSKNKLLLENISIVKILNLRDAQGHLVSLSRRRFFWNNAVRNKALDVLRSWE